MSERRLRFQFIDALSGDLVRIYETPERPVDRPVSKECSGTNAELPMSTPSFANRFAKKLSI